MFAKACLASTVGVLLGLTADAHALKPAMHAELTKQACVAAGLPEAFCVRAATENYNADAREWDDLHAHAQIDGGETACDAADKTARRVWVLGSDLRAELAVLTMRPDDEDAVGRAAAIVGRALHTIQDNCAHHGMPNPQHAWFSLADFCDGTRTSPDVQADAIGCARGETTAAMTAVAAAVREAGVARSLARHSCPSNPNDDGGAQQRPVCENRFLPAPWDACAFLGEAEDWDGIDRQWNNDAVVPALRAELAAGIAFRPPLASVCGGDPAAIAAPVSEPVVDVAGGTPSCNRAHLLCLGSADLDDHPFADEEAAADDGGGCAAGGNPGGASGALLLLGAILARRRRR